MIIKPSDIVIRNLLDMIVSGTVKPGDKIPSTERIAKNTGTSVISAREAIQNLATIGIVEIQHGRGIFISNGGPVIKELLEARKVIESYNASMAAQHITDVRLKELEALLNLMDEDFKRMDIESYSRRDYEFHILIGKASENRILLKTLENIRGLVNYQLLAINKVPGNMEKSSALHWELFRAIANKNSKHASSIMDQHIDHAINAWKTYNELQKKGGISHASAY
ncbi:MAG: FCD domain-containing protein [Bacteroidia bacterium]|jgi:GntR family transcriptional repressor for pyruvate dehydrogenase complex|nr:FCD domain-containing protein [Bacteroidia bacterium]